MQSSITWKGSSEKQNYSLVTGMWLPKMAYLMKHTIWSLLWKDLLNLMRTKLRQEHLCRLLWPSRNQELVYIRQKNIFSMTIKRYSMERKKKASILVKGNLKNSINTSRRQRKQIKDWGLVATLKQVPHFMNLAIL